MKGYNFFDADWKCRGFQYKIGKTYETNEPISLCRNGFHFCQKLEQCFGYYDAVTWNHIAEVEALGEVISGGDKSVTDKIKIIREITWNEIKNIYRSYGVNISDGVNISYGVNSSNGVNISYGVNRSYGVLNSFGVDNALFISDKKREYSIFGRKVSEERFERVYSNLHVHLDGWKPTFNNLKCLYLKYGSDWKKTPIPNAEEIQKEEAWRDMPVGAIEYLRTLPEFNSEMFFKITGIKVSKKRMEA